jgi:hypothetical protein
VQPLKRSVSGLSKIKQVREREGKESFYALFLRFSLQTTCQEIFETILTKEFSDFRYARVHRLTVDTYCLQP